MIYVCDLLALLYGPIGVIILRSLYLHIIKRGWELDAKSPTLVGFLFLLELTLWPIFLLSYLFLFLCTYLGEGLACWYYDKGGTVHRKP